MKYNTTQYNTINYNKLQLYTINYNKLHEITYLTFSPLSYY